MNLTRSCGWHPATLCALFIRLRVNSGMRRALGVLFLAGPFVAGAIAAASPRRDFRLIAVAIVATTTAWLIRPRGAPAVQAGLTFAGATVAAIATAAITGARALFGVVAVAVVVAAFAAAGRLLLSRPRGAPATSATGSLTKR